MLNPGGHKPLKDTVCLPITNNGYTFILLKKWGNKWVENMHDERLCSEDILVEPDLQAAIFYQRWN